MWEATTSLLVYPIRQDVNATGGRTNGAVNLDTEAQLVRSTTVATLAAARLATAVPPEELAAHVRVAVPPNTTVLEITYSAAHPEAARRGAQAFAEAYLAHREERASADVAAQMSTISGRIDELNEALTEVNERLATATPGTAAAADLETRRGTLTHQLGSLAGRLNELSTTTVSGGTVISEARTPTEPGGPPPAMVLASGTMLGLVVGAAAAVGADRLARRVRRPGDVSRWTRLPVLTVLTPDMTAPPPETLPPGVPGGRAFDRLRNEVLAALGSTGQVIVVASVSRGDAAGAVAANLAASLARSGNDVILLGSKEYGPAGAPGLSEVIAGRMPVAEALRRHPRNASLRSITVDELAVTAGQLQSPAVRKVLAALTRQAAYLVVEAPPTCASADAQSLAAHADTALLVVESRRARLAEVTDAVEQLRRVGRRPLGAVIVPPVRPRPWRGQRPAGGGRPARPESPLVDLLTAPSPTARPEPRRRKHPRADTPAVVPEPVRLPQVPTPQWSAPDTRRLASEDETITLPRLSQEVIRGFGGAARQSAPNVGRASAPDDRASALGG